MADVLVLEDDPDVLDTITELLTAEGLEVVGAPDTAAALRLLLAHGPRLLVADLHLLAGEVEEDGHRWAAEALRRYPGLGAVYVTGDLPALAARRLGARERALAKPFRPGALVALVRELHATA